MDDNDVDGVDELLSLLESLGGERERETVEGGACWAEFGDWCYASSRPRTQRTLDQWQRERPGGPLGEAALRRLENLIVERGR